MKKIKNNVRKNYLTLSLMVLIITGGAAVHAIKLTAAKPVAVGISNTETYGTDQNRSTGRSATAPVRPSASATVISKPTKSTPALTPATSPSVIATRTTPPAAATPTANALADSKFYYNPTTDAAAAQIAAWNGSRPADAVQLSKIAGTPRAVWLAEWSGDIQTTTTSIVNAASAQGSVATLVAYNIPGRDCGNYSAGGAGSAADYTTWISAMANGIAGRKTVVILEPDALGLISCLSQANQEARYSMLSQAVGLLSARGALVYIDASTWVQPVDMASRLSKAGINQAQGFSLNVSGFQKTSTLTAYANQLSGLVGGKHYVLDTSRNGAGTASDWCNPAGQALGARPQGFASGALDAFLWIKSPGESDGTCNGGPSAGTFWPDYAIGLASRS